MADTFDERDLLADYWTEPELARQLKKTVRTMQRWRKLRIGPPVTFNGKEPIYSKESARRWLKAGERSMVRERTRQRKPRKSQPERQPNAAA